MTKHTLQGLKESSASYRERADCAVCAVAVTAGVEYEVAHAALCEQGRLPRRGTTRDQIHGALRKLGFEVQPLLPGHFIDQYPGRHATALKNVTTHHPERFPAVWQDGERYLFYVNQHTSAAHVLGVADGEVVDWTKGKAKRVNYIYRVRKARC